MASVHHRLIPRASLALHSRQLQHRLFLPALRNATTAHPPPPKPRVLEKPERFNPPSHPSRLRKPRQYPGPPLSQHERQAQRTRRYPHMMPPEGTFMHWFLTNRAVHAWITMTVLIGLVFAIWFTDFKYNTAYADLLPPNNMFYSHPLTFISRYWEVYRMHVEHVSAETQERRRRKVEDVAKRSEYRKAHGLDSEEGLFGGWTAKADSEVLGPAVREGSAPVPGLPGPATAVEVDHSPIAQSAREGEEGVYVDFEGKPQPVRKKWFGIW